jgi:hypothetical protein
MKAAGGHKQTRGDRKPEPRAPRVPVRSVGRGLLRRVAAVRACQPQAACTGGRGAMCCAHLHDRARLDDAADDADDRRDGDVAMRRGPEQPAAQGMAHERTDARTHTRAPAALGVHEVDDAVLGLEQLGRLAPHAQARMYAHNTQHTTHNTQRTTHNAQRTTHNTARIRLYAAPPARRTSLCTPSVHAHPRVASARPGQCPRFERCAAAQLRPHVSLVAARLAGAAD